MGDTVLLLHVLVLFTAGASREIGRHTTMDSPHTTDLSTTWDVVSDDVRHASGRTSPLYPSTHIIGSGHDASEAYTSSTVSGHDASEAYTSRTVSGHDASEAYTSSTVSGHDASEAYTSSTVSGHDASEAYTSSNVSGHDASEAYTSSTVSGHDASEAYTSSTVSGHDASEAYTRSTASGHDASEAYTSSTVSGHDASEGNINSTDNEFVFHSTTRKKRSFWVTTDDPQHKPHVSSTESDLPGSGETEPASSKYEVLGPIGFATLNQVLSWAGLCTSLLGVVLNSLAIAVLTRMNTSATNSYMTGLTVLDILYLLMTLVPFSFNVVMGSSTLNNRFYVYYAKYVSSGLMASTRRTIICVTTMLCLERLIAIALPLRAVKSRLIRNPKAFIFGTFIVVMVLNVHLFFKNYISDVFDPRTNTTRIAMIRTTFFEENVTMFAVTGYILSALFVYMPLLTIVICNVWLVVALHRHSTARSSYKAEGQPIQFFVLERQTAILILTYTVLFVLLALPYALHGVVEGLIPTFSMQGSQIYLYIGMQRLYGVLDVLSSSMNFPVYLARSSDFRLQLLALLGFRTKAQGAAPISIRTKHPVTTDRSLRIVE